MVNTGLGNTTAMASNTVTSEVARAFSTLREMLADRGLDVSSLESISNEDVAGLARARSRNDDIFSVDLPSCSMRIVFNLKPRFSMGDVKKLLLMSTSATAAPAGRKPRGAVALARQTQQAQEIDEEGEDGEGDGETTGETFVAGGGSGGGAASGDFIPSQFIVVARQKPAQGKSIDDPARNIQLFLIGDLMFNVTKHELQPMRFVPIRDEAAIQEIMTEYRLKTKNQFPLILSSDVIARYYALKPGQLLQITCRSPSAGTYIKYRCCS